ncbi:hypothetical protein Cgig2_023540 [Carnegiea gigantea]|uniref:Uncharacterized protein n=1 Tax=Carnegiea gigantea TaxID=171969 RepID=A0A9Q1GIP9_9CARY|nr:hypothetical protein Cgig2_023540 [Carnegiea gigantea]
MARHNFVVKDGKTLETNMDFGRFNSRVLLCPLSMVFISMLLLVVVIFGCGDNNNVTKRRKQDSNGWLPASGEYVCAGAHHSGGSNSCSGNGGLGHTNCGGACGGGVKPIGYHVAVKPERNPSRVREKPKQAVTHSDIHSPPSPHSLTSVPQPRQYSRPSTVTNSQSTSMDGGSQLKTIGTPTPSSDPGPSPPPPPPVSSSARRPPCPPHDRGGRSSFAEVDIEQINEVDPSDFPAASKATKLESSFVVAMVLKDSNSDGQAETKSDVGMEAL